MGRRYALARSEMASPVVQSMHGNDDRAFLPFSCKFRGRVIHVQSPESTFNPEGATVRLARTTHLTPFLEYLKNRQKTWKRMMICQDGIFSVVQTLLSFLIISPSAVSNPFHLRTKSSTFASDTERQARAHCPISPLDNFIRFAFDRSPKREKSHRMLSKARKFEVSLYVRISP